MRMRLTTQNVRYFLMLMVGMARMCSATTLTKLHEDVDGCKGGFFTSERYPYQYPNNTHYVWNITVDRGFTVWLRFDDFCIESSPYCTYDSVCIFYGGVLHDRPYCGDRIPGPFSSPGNHLTVKFKTNGAVTRRGFKATYGPHPPDCGDYSCLNGGTCTGCSCVCLTGLQGRHCEKPNPPKFSLVGPDVVSHCDKIQLICVWTKHKHLRADLYRLYRGSVLVQNNTSGIFTVHVTFEDVGHIVCYTCTVISDNNESHHSEEVKVKIIPKAPTLKLPNVNGSVTEKQKVRFVCHLCRPPALGRKFVYRFFWGQREVHNGTSGKFCLRVTSHYIGHVKLTCTVEASGQEPARSKGVWITVKPKPPILELKGPGKVEPPRQTVHFICKPPHRRPGQRPLVYRLYQERKGVSNSTSGKFYVGVTYLHAGRVEFTCTVVISGQESEHSNGVWISGYRGSPDWLKRRPSSKTPTGRSSPKGSKSPSKRSRSKSSPSREGSAHSPHNRSSPNKSPSRSSSKSKSRSGSSKKSH